MNKRKLVYDSIFILLIVVIGLVLGYFSATVLINVLKDIGISGPLLSWSIFIPIPLYIYVALKLNSFRKTLRATLFKE
jgi:hypothetical protein